MVNAKVNPVVFINFFNFIYLIDFLPQDIDCRQIGYRCINYQCQQGRVFPCPMHPSLEVFGIIIGSPELKGQVSLADQVLSVCKLFIFRTTGPISTELGTSNVGLREFRIK